MHAVEGLARNGYDLDAWLAAEGMPARLALKTKTVAHSPLDGKQSLEEFTVVHQGQA